MIRYITKYLCKKEKHKWNHWGTVRTCNWCKTEEHWHWDKPNWRKEKKERTVI